MKNFFQDGKNLRNFFHKIFINYLDKDINVKVIDGIFILVIVIIQILMDIVNNMGLFTYNVKGNN